MADTLRPAALARAVVALSPTEEEEEESFLARARILIRSEMAMVEVFSLLQPGVEAAPEPT